MTAATGRRAANVAKETEAEIATAIVRSVPISASSVGETRILKKLSDSGHLCRRQQ